MWNLVLNSEEGSDKNYAYVFGRKGGRDHKSLKNTKIERRCPLSSGE